VSCVRRSVRVWQVWVAGAFGLWLACGATAACSSGGAGAFPDAGASDSGRDAGHADVQAPPVSCMAYCTSIGTSCTGANTEYAGMTPQQAADDCAHLCAAMSPGMYGDTADTLGCRQYQGDGIAMRGGSPATFCTPAGPFGGGVCGDRCSAFCKYAVALCTTANGNPEPWPSVSACMAACATYPWDPDAGEFDPNDTNHLNCFEYHLRAAYLEPDADIDDSGQTTAQQHCGDLITDPDAAPGGQPTCVQ
jgi:hypothetical protein